MRTTIRDNRNRPLGHVSTSNNGNSRLYDKNGANLVAFYSKGANSTYSANGRLIGKGNVLQTQIKP